MVLDIRVGDCYLQPISLRAHVQNWSSMHSFKGGNAIPQSSAGTRKIRIYAVDPTLTALENPAITVDVPYEPLLPGPVGARFRIDPQLPTEYLQLLKKVGLLAADETAAPLNLEHAATASSGGIESSTGDPRFAAQMCYAIAEHLYETFTVALGRAPVFGHWQQRRFERDEAPQLCIRPHASIGDNAHYDRGTGTIKFGFALPQDTQQPGMHQQPVDQQSQCRRASVTRQYALSHDIVCHEITHAIVDGVRPHFLCNSDPQSLAFHEAFSDLIALMHHFRSKDLVHDAIRHTGGVGTRALLALGRGLGEMSASGDGTALRMAFDNLASEMIDDANGYEYGPGHSRANPFPRNTSALVASADSNSPHQHSAAMVAAFLESFITLFRTRARPLRRLAGSINSPAGVGNLPTELVDMLTRQTNKLADQFLNILIAALDFTAPVKITPADYLRAVVTSDMLAMPNDRYDYRGAMIRAALRHGIGIGDAMDPSPLAVSWPSDIDGLPAFARLARYRLAIDADGATPCDLAEARLWAESLGSHLHQQSELLQELGLRQTRDGNGPITIESIVPTALSRYGKLTRFGLVATITQRQLSDTGEYLRGCTIIIDSNGGLMYSIKK